MLYFPTLSEDSWVTDPSQMLDYLFSHFFLADYSQTQLYLREISSLPWIIQQGQGDLLKTVRDIKTTLTAYFGRYFSTVTVEVSETDSMSVDPKASLSIYVSVVDTNGKQAILGKLVEILDSKIYKIITINNG
jgi:hypothetical protein